MKYSSDKLSEYSHETVAYFPEYLYDVKYVNEGIKLK